MEKHVRIDEPVVDRWPEVPEETGDVERKVVSLPFFGLSGGVMKSNARTDNRIDGLLTRMMEHPSSGKYSRNIDKNLEYLHTYLKLDIISMAAEEIRSSRLEEKDD